MSVPTVHPLMRHRGFRWATIGLLLLVMFSLAVDSLRRESVTFDEPQHLTSGYTAWAFNDYRLEVNHGQLPQRWFALPLLIGHVKFPSRDDDSWHRPGYLGLQACFEFFFNSGNDPDAMVFRGRLMAVVITLLVVLAVYGWTARVFGPAAGLLAGFLCAMDPTMLAHGRLMTSDVTAALFFLMSVGCFWSLLRRFTWFRLASSTVCFGLLLVSKMSGFMAVPMALLIFLSRMALGRSWPVQLSGFRPRRACTLPGKLCLGGGAALAHLLVALAIIWCFYGWQFKPSPNWIEARDSYVDARDTVFDALGPLRTPFLALDKWEVLPDAYLYGLAHTWKDVGQWSTFLNGRYSPTGWWYYFPYCFLVKTPLTLLALIGLGAGSLGCRVARHGSRRRAVFLALLDRTSLIWSLLLVYGGAAIFSNLNIGQRHLLPIYPPLFMLAGAAGGWFLRGGRGLRAATAVLLMLQLVVIARIHPHYLAYFNELVGGPGKGYLHLTDSNVDWGQDLPSFSRWLREHRSLASEGDLYFDYFGFDPPQRWGVQALGFPSISNPRLSSADPITCRAGLYCFSATALIEPGRGRPPWDKDSEREYRELLSKYRALDQTNPLRPDDAESVKRWRPLVTALANSQFYRLKSYLMGRRPDAMTGYSILIFHLSDAELRTALLP